MQLQTVLCFSYIYVVIFYKIIFKIKHKLHMASGLIPPPPIKKIQNLDLRTTIIYFM